MNANENDIFSYLKKKYNLVYELLRVTKIVELTGDDDKFEEEAEDYIFLIEKRGDIIHEIENINNKLKSLNYDALKDSKTNPLSVEAEKFETETKNIISQIIEIDRLNNTKVNLIFANLKNSIKGINMGKNINAAYSGNLSEISGGLFDRKQ